MPSVINYTYNFGPLAGPIPTNYLGGNLTGNFGDIRSTFSNANTYIGYGVDTGAADAYVVSMGAGISATLTAGLWCYFKASNPNTGGAATINVQGTGVKSLVMPDTSNPPLGAIVAGGVYLVLYNGTAWQLNAGSTAAPTNGAVTQVASVIVSAGASGTTQVPLDNTIMQNTEGDQYMSLSITPKLATNILTITTTGVYTASSADASIVASLFQDAIADALATSWATCGPISSNCHPFISFRMVAGTTSPITFKVRAGSSTSSPGGTVTYFNSYIGGGNLFGGKLNSFIYIEEVQSN